MSGLTDNDADDPSSILATQLPVSPISARGSESEYLPEDDVGPYNGATEVMDQSDDGPQSDIDGDEIGDQDDGGDEEDSIGMLEPEYKLSKHREIADFRALLKVLEYNHRASLSEHLVASERLRAEDERSRPQQGNDYQNGSDGSGTQAGTELYTKRIVPPSWTAWPLPSWELPLDNTSEMRKEDLSNGFDYVHESKESAFGSSDADVDERHDNEQLQEEEYGYESYRLSTHKLFVPSSNSKRLISEISAAGVRSLTRQWRVQARMTRGPLRQDSSSVSEDDDISNMMYSNDEIEKSLLYPHLHVSILQLVNGIMDAMIAMRTTQAPETTRGKLRTMKWNDLLNVAALIGMPALDGVPSRRSWLSVIEMVRKQCEQLFPDGRMQKYRLLEQGTDRLREDIEPGRLVVGKGANSRFRRQKGGEFADSSVEDDSDQQSLASSSQITSRKRKKRRRKRKHRSLENV
ncbi:hypothetical protein V1520DRAFT_111473 [Lipomyces starkeyi]|uniref:Rrn9 domain-containing protein n=1 Tax=Lipomyces starkeyi NRRL Y-11557 TaxID=675824 RepID=A0A1E3Q7H5_LIPST|nr:hypothetical protein LIPSTDRAFT_265815 [Lipomyces starkeyi NRRL Y-11557]